MSLVKPRWDFDDDIMLKLRVKWSVWSNYCQAGCGQRLFAGRKYCGPCIALQNKIAKQIAEINGDKIEDTKTQKIQSRSRSVG